MNVSPLCLGYAPLSYRSKRHLSMMKKALYCNPMNQVSTLNRTETKSSGRRTCRNSLDPFRHIPADTKAVLVYLSVTSPRWTQLGQTNYKNNISFLLVNNTDSGLPITYALNVNVPAFFFIRPVFSTFRDLYIFAVITEM